MTRAVIILNPGGRVARPGEPSGNLHVTMAEQADRSSLSFDLAVSVVTEGAAVEAVTV